MLVDVLGRTVSIEILAIGGVIGLVALYLAVSILLSWVRKLLVRLALRHAVYAGLSVAGVSLGALVPNPIQRAVSTLSGLLDAILAVGGIG